MSQTLAIIVPAFKARYLQATLESICAQKDQEFTLHVFDDASPEGIGNIVARFPKASYHRFEENLGGKSLVKHWNRCVEAVVADFVWLFSDDDLMDPDCVQSFRKTLCAHPEVDVFRFATNIIDAQGSVTCRNPFPPTLDTSEAFLHAKMHDRRKSFLPEYLFRRSVFQQQGGFVELPLAWNSDDASWALFGRAHGIALCGEARVSWRYSGENISSRSTDHLPKILADLEFVRWIDAHFPALASDVRIMLRIRLRKYYYVDWKCIFYPGWWHCLKAMTPSQRRTLILTTTLGRSLWRRTKKLLRRP